MKPLIHLSELIERFGGTLIGEDIAISRIFSIERAQKGDLTFITQARYVKALEQSKASAVITSPKFPLDTDLPQIVTDDPYLYFANVSQLLNPRPVIRAGVHSSAVIGEHCQISESAEIQANVVIGDHVHIGEHVRIGAGSVIGNHVHIGAHTEIYPRVTIYDRSQIGKHCVIHAGAVIGSDGFGMAWGPEGWVDIAQIGRAVLHDYVHVGANTTIDRGALEDTVIEQGVRLDNQIQIAHNVRVGKHTAMAACVGIAGSTKIGAHCMIGGAGMISGHLTIGDKVHISGGTLVSSSLPEAGHYTAVYPLSTHQEWVKNAAQVRQIGRLRDRVRQLEQLLTKTFSFHQPSQSLEHSQESSQ